MSNRHGQYHSPRKVSAIVPAYNEQDTIRAVVNKIASHPLIDEVIVVSDGSTDNTADEARATPAHVIELTENRGKGIAMDIGVEKAQYDILVFFDADILGLSTEMMDKLIGRVRSGKYEMFTLVRDRKSETFQLYVPNSLIVGGERAVTRSLWEKVPQEDKKGFGIELALNYFAKKHGMHTGYALAKGLAQIPKEKKRGLFLGLWLRFIMTAECVKAYCKLFILRLDS